MKKVLLCIGVSFVLMSWITVAMAVNPLFQKQFSASYHETLADRFFATREVPGNLNEAEKNYLKALAVNSEQPDTLWKLTRCYWTQGEHAVGTPEKTKYFNKAISYGKRAISTQALSSSAHLWYGLSLGSLAVEKGVMSMMHQRDLIKNELNLSLKLNPKQIGGFLGLASWHFFVPPFLGGSRQKSFELLDQAIQMDPNYTATILLKAKLLNQDNQFNAATRELKRLLNLQHPTSQAAGIEDKTRAGEMLKKMKNARNE